MRRFVSHPSVFRSAIIRSLRGKVPKSCCIFIIPVAADEKERYYQGMSRIAVVFRSKYGASKEYALALGKRLSAEVIENEGLTAHLVEEFDSIILIGGVYAGKITGLEFMKKYIGDFSEKRLAVFAVGAAPESEDNISDLRKHNMKGRMEMIPLYYGRGAFNEGALSFVDRNLLSIVRKAAEKTRPEKRTPLDNVLLETKGAESWIDERYLDPLVSLFCDL